MTKQEREWQVKQAIANKELEGNTVPKDALNLMSEYIAGTMTKAQIEAQAKKRLKLKKANV